MVAGDRAALEWRTDSPAGQGLSYDGVTMLELAGQALQRLWAYFNPAVPGERLAAAADGQ